MAIYCLAHISKNVRELIQSKKYESILVRIMNDSQVIFPSKYRHIDIQSHGECDFIDQESNTKYDAKLLFSNEQCQYLAKGISHLQQWLESLLIEINESNQALLHQYTHDVTQTSLYKEMLSRLNSIAQDEYAVLFIPFPIIPDVGLTVYSQFATDIIIHTYNCILASENPPQNKGAYLIYPSIFCQKLVLRKLDSGEREYLPINYIQDYISFEFKSFEEDADIIRFQ